MRYYLAIDLGASGGRHILGWAENSGLCTQEIYRFPNKPLEKNGRFFWDTRGLFEHILAGLKKCKELNKVPVSVSIDTWGVDYALLDQKDNLVGDVYCYRDGRTEKGAAFVHGQIPHSKLFAKTGTAFNIYNTVYQLADDVTTGRIQKAHSFLMLPDYFHFLLTGVKSNEYTIATTTGLLNAKTKEWDTSILSKLGFPERLFQKIQLPQTVLGGFRKEIQAEVGFNAQVVLCGTHDTASAVASAKKGTIYLSSGTWSLIGTELPEARTDEESRLLGYTNEGGCFGGIRFLKNNMGLWLIQCLERDFKGKYSFPEMAALARENSGATAVIDVNHPRFFNPSCMKDEIEGYCKDQNLTPPKNDGELFYCVYNSLALSYAKAIRELETLTGKTYDTVNIVGGGSKNLFLSELTAKTTGKNILSGPSEATAEGNLRVQMQAQGEKIS